MTNSMPCLQWGGVELREARSQVGEVGLCYEIVTILLWAHGICLSSNTRTLHTNLTPMLTVRSFTAIGQVEQISDSAK